MNVVVFNHPVTGRAVIVTPAYRDRSPAQQARTDDEKLAITIRRTIENYPGLRMDDCTVIDDSLIPDNTKSNRDDWVVVDGRIYTGPEYDDM